MAASAEVGSTSLRGILKVSAMLSSTARDREVVVFLHEVIPVMKLKAMRHFRTRFPLLEKICIFLFAIKISIVVECVVSS